MNKDNYITYQANPESTIGVAVSDAIEMAKKTDKKVVINLRDTTCVITKHTKLFDGIEHYRKNIEKSVRARN